MLDLNSILDLRKSIPFKKKQIQVKREYRTIKGIEEKGSHFRP
jgi:hypothetical protein